MVRRSTIALLVALFLCLVPASGRLLADEWPQWRGPNRDGKSAETGLLKSWPQPGPKLLWTASGCGTGYGSPAVTGKAIYLLGDVDGKCALLAFDLEGKRKAGLPFSAGHPDRQYPGARSTPTVDDGLVFALSPHGDLLCADAATLSRKWSVNILQKFKGRAGGWKIAESPLVDGNNVIVTPGGPDAGIVALNKRTGDVVWTSKGLSDPAAYASCIKVIVSNMPQIVTLTAKGLVGVSARTGQFLWRYDRPSNDTANCPSPVFEGARVFAASGYGAGGGAVDIKVSPTGAVAQQAWDTKDMVCHHGGYVLVDGYLYGNHGGGWACIDWKTGATKYKASGVGKGNIIYADGMLYCMSENGGRVALVKAAPDGHSIVSQFSIPAGGQGSTWAHMAISNGRLYIRHGDFLYAYDIKAN